MKVDITKLTLSVFIFALIASCSSVEPLEELDFEGFSQIKEGETAQIKWQVKNATTVSIKGFSENFEWKDTIEVSPIESTKYYFTFLNEKDTIEKVWRVYVKANPTVISENNKSKLNYDPSYTNSDYFKGVLESGKITNPYQMKVMKISYPIIGDKAKINALILDEFGNYLPGLSNQFVNWSSAKVCDNGIVTEEIAQYKENPLISNDIDFGIMLDNSAAAEFKNEVLGNIKKFALDLNKKDRFMLSYFNQNTDIIYPLNGIDTNKIKNISIPESSGLNALNKSAFSNIVSLKGGNNEKALVIVAFSSNNAATIYNPQDIIKSARKYKVPVYIITIGDAIDSYTLKYISGASGGRFYNLSQDEIFKIPDVLNEIRFSMYTSYEFDVTLKNAKELKCPDDIAQIKLNFNDKEYIDEIELVGEPDWMTSRHQAIAAFDYKKADLSKDFDDLISSLARVLKDNPTYSVELIGHSSIEGSSENNVKISKERAEAVAAALAKEGVDKTQIKTRGEGSNMPIYYMPHSPWQQYYNRRVEVRWLIPEMLPYEIIADQFWTEEEAIQMVNQWRERGFRSYYQRYLVNNKPTYRIKLWGYETLKEAENVVASIDKKYNLKAEIE